MLSAAIIVTVLANVALDFSDECFMKKVIIERNPQSNCIELKQKQQVISWNFQIYFYIYSKFFIRFNLKQNKN